MERSIPAWILLALMLCGAQQACRRSPNTERMAAVDRLMHTLDSLQQQMDTLDTLPLFHMEQLFASERDRIEARFHDTLDAATAAALGNYHHLLADGLPEARTQRTLLRQQLDSSRSRFMDLQHDVQHALMDDPEEASALAREQQELGVLQQAVADGLARLDRIQREQERDHPAVDSLLHASPSAHP